MENYIIRTENLSFSYDDYIEDALVANNQPPALDNVSVSVRKGEYIAVLGHNGSGKSTFAKLLNMILEPVSGKVYIYGRDITDENFTEDDMFDIRSKIGMVFQNPDNQLVATVVEEDVAFGPENLGLPREEIRKRVDEALETVDMTEYAHHAPHKLSGGQKQRVAIAGIIAMKPDVIILDEVSMIDIFLFSQFLDAVRFGCRVILVGDPNQLPAVDAGNVLGDIISSGIVPVVELTEIFRQAKESLIVTNAHAVIEGRQPVLDAKDNDFFFMLRDNPLTASKTTAELCCERLPRAYGFSPISDIQVLCPSRKGDCGTINLNRHLQSVLNPYDEKKTECKVAGRLFREGDKVMQIKNNYDIPWERGPESGSGLFNGDIGIISEINVKNECMRIVFDDDREVVYPIPSAAELELAYAVTVHKSQGSEYDCVLMPVADVPPMLLYRNLLYTAITRAKKMMIVVGSKYKIDKMIENNKQNKRYSMLRTMLES